jgi:hypothetical protein
MAVSFDARSEADPDATEPDAAPIMMMVAVMMTANKDRPAVPAVPMPPTAVPADVAMAMSSMLPPVADLHDGTIV